MILVFFSAVLGGWICTESCLLGRHDHLAIFSFMPGVSRLVLVGSVIELDLFCCVVLLTASYQGLTHHSHFQRGGGAAQVSPDK
jgi:hypothetical protein